MKHPAMGSRRVNGPAQRSRGMVPPFSAPTPRPGRGPARPTREDLAATRAREVTGQNLSGFSVSGRRRK